MQQRINAFALGNKTLTAFNSFGQSVLNSSLDESLMELICFRVSQLNNCGYCLDMHSKKLRANGETEQRLYLISAWHEAPFYTEKERAALAFAEALTQVKSGLVSEEIFAVVKSNFTETEIIDLMMAIITINGYNRINIALGSDVGTFQLGQYQ